MKQWLIKLLGGYTSQELESIKTTEYNRGRNSVNQQRKKYSFGWLKQQIHKNLDIIFPPSKEFDRARYRWLKENTLTTDHISKMSYDELLKTHERVVKMMGEAQ